MKLEWGRVCRRFCFAPLLPGLFLAAPALAADAPCVTVTQLSSATATASGQPILLPQGDARVIASLYLIPPGARLPLHEHPYPRFAYVMAGTLRVTDTDTHQSFTYRPGMVIIEVVGQWHYAENPGPAPVRLLVLDTVPKDKTGNTVKAQAQGQ